MQDRRCPGAPAADPMPLRVDGHGRLHVVVFDPPQLFTSGHIAVLPLPGFGLNGRLLSLSTWWRGTRRRLSRRSRERRVGRGHPSKIPGLPHFVR